MENESYTSILGAADAPYESALARACGVATNYQAISHPSLPNYLAATGGSTFGITDDGEPAAHPISAPSLFSQIDSAGESWRAYDESMPYNCDPVTAGEYAARHNPAVYYRSVHAECERSDVPLGSINKGSFAKAAAAGTLPNFAFVSPNTCDDAHSCPVSEGDAWLSRFLPVLFASPQYRAGSVVLFLTYDEGSGSNQVLTIVAARSVQAGTRSAVAFSHYSLLHSTELLLGLSPLGAAGRAASMVGAFGLSPSALAGRR
jgi:phospholipase C